QLGDMILATPFFRAVRARAPHARLDVVTAPMNHAPLLHSERITEAIPYDKKHLLRNPAAARRFLERLRDAHYDLALVSSTVAFSYTSVWLAAISGARRRAARPGPGGAGASTVRDAFHWALPVPIPERHQSAVNLDLATPFGASDDDWTPEIFLTSEERKRGADALERAIGNRTDGLRILLHPGAGKRPNRWPAERFGELAAALRAEGHRVAVATGPSEIELFEGVDRGAEVDLPRLEPLPVRALAGAFAAADVALVNDTGVLHLASAVGTPTLAWFGPTDPRQWCPAAPRTGYFLAPGGELAALAVAD
ncbi:MAG: glycosyltransferase family 9 protein, partial [Gemmatimonadetes bacterium]|nr:glycosyltransferase family 9 protein [Gemmatimonadota bacterium]